MYDHVMATRNLLAEVGARVTIVRSFPDPIQVIKPGYDGFLMETDFDQRVEIALTVTVPKDRNIQAVVVHSFTKDKTVVNKRDKADGDKPYRQFQKIVKSRMTKDETMSTKHDVNNIRLVVAENGIFQMWEIAVPTRIISATASFFLTIQRLYRATMYNLDGKIYMPEHEYAGYQEWAGLQQLLGRMVQAETLPSIRRPIEAPPIYPVANGSHRVTFFCLASGLGLAQTRQGPAFIHWKELPRNDRFACISKGQLVSGDVVATDKGLQLKNIKTLD